VVVCHKGVLSVYRLVAGQPAALLARRPMLFKHYSVAASPCGQWVAASGASGLVSLYRAVRGSCTSSSSSTDEAAAQAPAPEAQAAGSSGGQAAVGAGGPATPPQQQQPQQPQQAAPAADAPLDPDDLPWRLVHVATLLCKNGPETMVNSVRFAGFGGKLRMLAAHQVRRSGGRHSRWMSSTASPCLSGCGAE
jgi:hypothetical protein